MQKLHNLHQICLIHVVLELLRYNKMQDLRGKKNLQLKLLYIQLIQPPTIYTYLDSLDL